MEKNRDYPKTTRIKLLNHIVNVMQCQEYKDLSFYITVYEYDGIHNDIYFYNPASRCRRPKDCRDCIKNMECFYSNILETVTELIENSLKLKITFFEANSYKWLYECKPCLYTYI